MLLDRCPRKCACGPRGCGIEEAQGPLVVVRTFVSSFVGCFHKAYFTWVQFMVIKLRNKAKTFMYK